MSPKPSDIPVLVLGGTGTIGRRLVTRLQSEGTAARPASRSTEPIFDWADPRSWPGVLAGVERMYLLLPDDTNLPEGFLESAESAGVQRVVLHSDRSVDIMSVTRLQAAECAVRDSTLDWTIIRPDWFDQDFETFFRQQVIDGHLCVPVGEVKQGFVDGNDIAAVATRALTTDDHLGDMLELTGPTALSFREAVDLIGVATGRSITFDGSSEAYRTEMNAAGLPDDVVESLIDAFAALAARGDTEPTGVVERVLGRPARSFPDYVTDAAARGVWG